MKIKQILSQHRRDFTAILVCDHPDCDAEQKLTSGYDDRNYHDNVIPSFECGVCHRKALPETLKVATKYPDGHQV